MSRAKREPSKRIETDAPAGLRLIRPIGSVNKMIPLIKKILLTVSITTLVLTACSQNKLSLSESEITVQGDTIFYSGKPFAKLWTIDTDAILLGKDALFSSQTVSGFGLAIHYFDSDKDVWIHPRKGLSIYFDDHTYNKVNEMQQVWDKSRKQIRAARGFPIRLAGQYMDKEDVIRSVVYGVKISNDGKYVRFKSQGMLWNSSHKYRIENERSE